MSLRRFFVSHGNLKEFQLSLSFSKTILIPETEKDNFSAFINEQNSHTILF